jgi:hypothetical protein
MPDGQEPLANQALATFVLTLYDDLDALVSLREVLFLPPGYTAIGTQSKPSVHLVRLGQRS